MGAVRAARPINADCEKAVAALRRKCPDAFPPAPLKPGQPGRPIELPTETAAVLYGSAFAATAGPRVAEEQRGVVWTQGDDELLVRLADVRVRILDGLVLVGVPVFCEQTGDTEIVVAFAVGAPDAPTGMLIATEDAPRGPAIIVDRWGEALVDAAHRALLHLAQDVAAVAGTDIGGDHLLPAALEASDAGLSVLPQARHAFDRHETA